MLSTRCAAFPVPFHVIQSELDRLFNGISTAPLARSRRNGGPALNVWEDDKGYWLESEFPGLSLNDLELYVTGDQLTLSGKRENERSDKATFHRRERSCGTFKRVITFPAAVDAAGVEATLKDGVLTIGVPKAQAARARKIEVRS